MCTFSLCRGVSTDTDACKQHKQMLNTYTFTEALTHEWMCVRAHTLAQGCSGWSSSWRLTSGWKQLWFLQAPAPPSVLQRGWSWKQQSWKSFGWHLLQYTLHQLGKINAHPPAEAHSHTQHRQRKTSAVFATPSSPACFALAFVCVRRNHRRNFRQQPVTHSFCLPLSTYLSEHFAKHSANVEAREGSNFVISLSRPQYVSALSNYLNASMISSLRLEFREACNSEYLERDYFHRKTGKDSDSQRAVRKSQ